MARLNSGKRRAIWQKLMKEASADHEVMAFSKSAFLAAVNAVDAFLENSAPALNAAIPPVARAALTDRQKARLLFAVAEARFAEA